MRTKRGGSYISTTQTVNQAYIHTDRHVLNSIDAPTRDIKSVTLQQIEIANYIDEASYVNIIRYVYIADYIDNANS